MYNVAIKSLYLVVLSLSVSLVSCSSESETARAARELYEQAEASNLSGDPHKALLLLDSLQATYKTETDWQRSAMKLRPTVMINDTENQIKATDDSIAMLEQQYNNILPLMKRIADPRLVEPYYVDKATYNADFMKTTGVQPRVSEIGQFYFVSSVNPGGLKHTGFTLSSGEETATVGPVPYDGEMNYRINGSEVITYSPDQSDPAAMFVLENSERSIVLTITGDKIKKINLNLKQINAIINCYNFSQSIVKARQLAFERERLNRQLDIARSQAERLSSISGDK